MSKVARDSKLVQLQLNTKTWVAIEKQRLRKELLWLKQLQMQSGLSRLRSKALDVSKIVFSRDFSDLLP